MSKPPGILVVDDQQESLTALEALLEPLGHRLVTARSGEEALRHLLDDDFGVIQASPAGLCRIEGTLN